MESKAALTNRKVLLVPKAKSLIIQNAKKKVAENPNCETLCIYEQAIPKATLLACTDASAAMEVQSTTTHCFGIDTGHWLGGKRYNFKHLARGSVGVQGVEKFERYNPQTSAISPAIPRKRNELLKCVIARLAAWNKAKARQMDRQKKPNTPSPGNMTDAKDDVPHLCSIMTGKTMKKKTKRKRRKDRNLIKEDATTDTPRTGKLILHDNRGHQYQVPKADTKRSSCGCRYLDKEIACKWGCEPDWILCHAFMRNECSNTSRTNCEYGYHRHRENGVAHEVKRPPKPKKKTCTCGECCQEKKRRPSLDWGKPVRGSHKDEPSTECEKYETKSEHAIQLRTSPVTIKRSWSITFDEDMGKTRRQANRSSPSASRRHKRFEEPGDSLLGPENSSRYEQDDDWTVEESTEQESEDDTDEDKRLFTRARFKDRRMADPVNRGATGRCDRTLQNMLRGSSERPWKRKSAFSDAASQSTLHNDRHQKLGTREAIQQCQQSVFEARKIRKST